MHNIYISAGDEVPAFWPYIDACLKALLGSINVPITDIAEEALSGLHSVLIAALADVTDAGHAQRTLEVRSRLTHKGGSSRIAIYMAIYIHKLIMFVSICVTSISAAN